MSSSSPQKPCRRRQKPTSPAVSTTTPLPTLPPGLEDYASFLDKKLITEDELLKLKKCMRKYWSLGSSLKYDDEPLPKRSFNLHNPPKITPKLNGTSRIRTQLYGHRVLQLCGAVLDHDTPIVPCYEGHQLTFDSGLREKIRAMQKWSPEQLQQAYERAELERLRDLATSVRPCTLPTRHNKSSRIRYRSVRNELVPSEHFRRSFTLYRKPPFMLNTRGVRCRSALPEKLPPIGKTEIWLYPGEGKTSAEPPLTSLKKTPPQDLRPLRLRIRPPLKPYKKRPRPRIKGEELLRRIPYKRPTTSKPKRISTYRRRTNRTEPYKQYKTPLPIVSVTDRTPLDEVAYYKERYIDARTSTSKNLRTDDDAHILDLRPLTSTATESATMTVAGVATELASGTPAGTGIVTGTGTTGKSKATKDRKGTSTIGTCRTTGTGTGTATGRTTGIETGTGTGRTVGTATRTGTGRTTGTATGTGTGRTTGTATGTGTGRTVGTATATGTATGRTRGTRPGAVTGTATGRATGSRVRTGSAATGIVERTAAASESRTTKVNQRTFQKDESGKTIATRQSTTNMLDLDSLLGMSDDKILASTIPDFGRSVGGVSVSGVRDLASEKVERNSECKRGIYDDMLVSNVKTVVCD